MDYIPEDAEENNKHFVPQDPESNNNEPAKEYEAEPNEADEPAGFPAEALFQDPMASVNDDEIIEAAMDQAAADAEMADIPGVDHVNENVDIPGVDPVNDNNQRPRRANVGQWQSIRFADEQAHLHAQVFVQILDNHKRRIRKVISPHNNSSDLEHIAMI